MLKIDGRVLSVDDPELGALLARAHAARIRPLCLCREPGVEMYIARFDAGYHIKRMPNSGGRHAILCASFDPPPSMSGIGSLLGSAICANTQEDVTTLKLGFRLSKHRDAQKRSSAKRELTPSVKSVMRGMSLRAMLHYLVDLAGLNRWSSATESGRHWEIVRSRLLVAALGNVVAGGPLVDRMYLPESFSLAEKDRIVQRRQRHYSQLASCTGASIPLMLLIGEVKEFGNGRTNARMVIKHMGDAPFDLPGDMYSRLQGRFESEILLWNAVDESRLLVAATFGVSRAGLASIVDMTLMVTDRHWLGFDSMAEKALIDTLIREKRCFIKPLRYDASESEQLAAAVLLDAGEPRPLHIVTCVGGFPANGIGDPRPGEIGEVWTWASVDAMAPLPLPVAEASLRSETLKRARG